MLSVFKEIFGKNFINNTAFVLTHWSQNKRAKIKRRDNDISE